MLKEWPRHHDSPKTLLWRKKETERQLSSWVYKSVILTQTLILTLKKTKNKNIPLSCFAPPFAFLIISKPLKSKGQR